MAINALQTPIERDREGHRHPDPEIERARTLARWTDTIPLDPLLGLFLPGIGDLIGSFLGLYIVRLAVRKRTPAVVIARMMLNLGIDAVTGVIPVFGDLFDIAHRANQRNAELLAATHIRGRAHARDWLIILGAGALLALCIAGTVALTMALWRAIG
jgi:hypothetical protein